MRRPVVIGALMVAVVGVAWAAAAYENADLKFRIEPPADFVKAATPEKKDGFLGEPLALYTSPKLAETAGMLLMHHMDIPGGADYDTFKSGLADQLKQVFGDSFEVVEQKDVKIGDREGFSLDFKAPGDGAKPDPNGDIPHHVRWILLRDGDSKLIGLLYAARESAWEGLNAKFKASAKSLKALE